MTRLHEDHAFNAIALLVGGKNLFVDMETYVWRSNPESLTRKKETQEDVVGSMDAYLINADYTLTELVKHEVASNKIADILKKYILSFFRYYNIMKNAGIDKEYLVSFIERVKIILTNVPSDVANSLSYERIIENFYEDDAVRAMIKQNIIICVTIDDFLAMVFDVEEQDEIGP